MTRNSWRGRVIDVPLDNFARWSIQDLVWHRYRHHSLPCPNSTKATQRPKPLWGLSFCQCARQDSNLRPSA